MNTLLQTRGLTLRIGHDRTLCHDLDLTIEQGSNWAILGPNGSGKTTLLHSLAGLRQAQAGDIQLLGKNLCDYAARQRARHVGVVFQHQDNVFPATVMQTVLSGRHPYLSGGNWHALWQWESDEDKQLASHALQSMALSEMATRDVGTLSGGEYRRVEIATLLTQDPTLCLLDEPVNHLDLNYQYRIMQLLSQRVRDQQHSNIFVLHDINMASRFCSHGILMFDDGESCVGPMADILEPTVLERLYHCRFRVLKDGDNTLYLPAQ